MIVTDRNHLSYEVGIGYLGSPPTAAEQDIGQQLFGHLRTHSTPAHLSP